MLKENIKILKKIKFKKIIIFCLIICIFSLSVLAAQQSHPLSEIYPIDQNLDMGTYDINANILNIGGGYGGSGATIDSDGHIQTVGNLTFSGLTYLLNTMKINNSLEIDGSIDINAYVNFGSTNNHLQISPEGLSTNNLYWGNKLLCNVSEINCGFLLNDEIGLNWVKRTGDTMNGTLYITTDGVGLNILRSESRIGVDIQNSSYSGYFFGGDYGVYGTGGDYGVYGKYDNNYGYIGGLDIGLFGKGANIGIKGKSVLNGVKGINLVKDNTIGYLAKKDIENVYYGVFGIGDDYGVYGRHNTLNNYGYLGGEDIGVYGFANNYGVYGYGNLTGVIGVSNDSGLSVGVYGYGDLSADNSLGVVGILEGFEHTVQITDVGVYGAANENTYGYLGGENIGALGYGLGDFGPGSGDAYGVYGNSSSGYGVYGKGDIGLYGKFDNDKFGYIGADSSVVLSGTGYVGYVQRDSNHSVQLGYYNLIPGPESRAIAVRSRSVNANTDFNYGLYGFADQGQGMDIGVYGDGSDYGIYGTGEIGIYAEGSSVGVDGRGNDIGLSVGVYGYGDLSADNSLGVIGVLDGFEHIVQITDVGVYGAYDSDSYGYLGGENKGLYGSGINYGVYGEGIYYGIYGSGINYGVYGQGLEYGVYGDSGGDFHGVYGENSEIGIYGEGYNYSIYGEYGSGHFGYLGSEDYGAYGEHSDGNFGYLGSEDYGVYGENDNSSYFGYLGSEDYGVYAQGPNNNRAYLGGDGYGMWAYGTGNGLWVTTSSADGYGLYTDDWLYAGGTIVRFDNLDEGDYPTTVLMDNGGYLSISASSKRYKTNITDFETNFTKILDLQPKSFIYKDSNDSAIGYIAEELDEIGLNELVNYNNDNLPESIDNSLIPIYIVEILKNQRNDLKEHELEFKRQTKVFEDLKQEIEEFKKDIINQD